MANTLFKVIQGHRFSYQWISRDEQSDGQTERQKDVITVYAALH